MTLSDLLPVFETTKSGCMFKLCPHTPACFQTISINVAVAWSARPPMCLGGTGAVENSTAGCCRHRVPRIVPVPPVSLMETVTCCVFNSHTGPTPKWAALLPVGGGWVSAACRCSSWSDDTVVNTLNLLRPSVTHLLPTQCRHRSGSGPKLNCQNYRSRKRHMCVQHNEGRAFLLPTRQTKFV